MKKLFTLCFVAALGISAANSSVIIDGKEYLTDTISVKEIGPGAVHTMYRIPDFPLNINTIEVDMTQGYNRLELNQSKGQLGYTEKLADAYVRQKAEGKKPLAGANGSFWCVGREPLSKYVLGFPYGGCIHNGKIVEDTNMFRCMWDGGPQNTGQLGVDYSGKLYVGQYGFAGCVRSDKWEAEEVIHQVNRICYDGEVTMYNSFFGKERKFNVLSDYTVVFCDLVEGESWRTNKDIKLVVREVAAGSDQLFLRDYDVALTATAAHRARFDELAVGDNISVRYEWYALDDNSSKPDFENFIEGQSLVLKNGELTPLNQKSYCSMVYSRTAYGTNADGTKLFVIVIDKSVNKYGISNGCNTSVMCQILQQMGCTDLVSMDAGGSAQMMIEGEVVNVTTEGNPRAISNGMMLFSTAPDTEESKVVTRIEFADFRLEMPTLGMFAPQIRGYNKYGELIEENVQGVTYSCDEKIGKGGEYIYAGTEPAYGAVTAHYKGLSVSKAIQTQYAPMNLRIKPLILIDETRVYPIEVVGQIGREIYNYNPADMEWIVEDPEIAVVENGVMKGLKNGETRIFGSLGEFADTTTVKVEIANAAEINTDWSRWTFKGVGAANYAIDSNGAFTFDYKGGRGAYVQLLNEIPFYSLPDKIVMEFTTTVPFKEMKADLRGAIMHSPNYFIYNNEGQGFKEGETYKIEFDLSQIGDMKDIANYPLTLHSLRFTIQTSGEPKDKKTINITKLAGIYNHFNGVESVMQGKSGISVYPNPVTDGIITVGSTADVTRVRVCSLSGVLLLDADAVTAGGSVAVDMCSIPAGVYILKASNANETVIEKVIVK